MNSKRIARRPWVYSVEVQNTKAVQEVTVVLMQGWTFKVTGDNSQVFRSIKSAYESTNMLLVTRTACGFAQPSRAVQMANTLGVANVEMV